ATPGTPRRWPRAWTSTWGGRCRACCCTPRSAAANCWWRSTAPTACRWSEPDPGALQPGGARGLMAGIVRHREIAMPRLRACLSALLLACAFAAGATPPGFDGRAGVARVDQARIDAALSGLVDSGQIVGVSALIWQDGREAYFGAFGLADREAARPMARDTLVQIFSMTKPVTGVALMQLYEQGRFGLDDPVARYLPEFAATRVYGGTDAQGQPLLLEPRRPITIRDLLRHT